MHFKNKTIWITGASSGIGAALARQLAQQQANLILTARNYEALQEVQAFCLQHTNNCLILTADMLQTETLPQVTEKAIALFNGIDAVIFSAGKSQRSIAANTEFKVYKDLMDLNFFAPIIITQALLPHFTKQKTGHIVVLSSMAGLIGFPLRTGYAASKHALKGFFETLQCEHQVPGLHITIVSPGSINTPISLHALTANGKPHGQLDKRQLRGISVNVCAAKIIAAMVRKKQHIIIAGNERVLWWLWWFARPLYYRIARKKGLTS
jgi:dehydrogenase/reductase SDR family member 7B